MNRTASFALLAAALIALAPGIADAEQFQITYDVSGGPSANFTLTGSLISGKTDEYFITSLTGTRGAETVSLFTNGYDNPPVGPPAGGDPSHPSYDTYGMGGYFDNVLYYPNSGAAVDGFGIEFVTSGGAHIEVANFNDGSPYIEYNLANGADSNLANFTLTPSVSVPEPSSLAMCGIAGVVGLIVARRRRKRSV